MINIIHVLILTTSNDYSASTINQRLLIQHTKYHKYIFYLDLVDTPTTATAFPKAAP